MKGNKKDRFIKKIIEHENEKYETKIVKKKNLKFLKVKNPRKQKL
jgi:hypothetical protein